MLKHIITLCGLYSITIKFTYAITGLHDVPW